MKKILNILFRGLFIGFKSIILLYIMDIIIMVCSGISLFFIISIFGLLNGFIDGIIISIKNTIKNKLISGILGFLITICIIILSIKLNLPDIIADIFLYGEGGGGLEPGGRFGFTVEVIIYFIISLFLSFPITMVIFSEKRNNK